MQHISLTRDQIREILKKNGVITKTNVSKLQLINLLTENNLAEYLKSNQNKQTSVRKQKIIQF